MADVLETMKAELDECVALLRPHYPEQNDARLRDRAIGMLGERYARGRWPSNIEIAGKAAAEKAAAEKAAAEKAAAEKAAAEKANAA